MDLYGLLPAVVRYFDRYSSGITGLDATETTLQKIVYAIEQETDVSNNLVVELQTLFDADNVREQFLNLIGKFLGCNFFGSWPEDKRRLFAKALIKLYHSSGQKECWKAVLNFLGYNGAVPYELWKDTVYEDFDYFRNEGDYYGVYHAARIDVDSKSGGLLNEFLSEEDIKLLDNFRPIHVLIQKQGEFVCEKDDTLIQVDQDDFSANSELQIEEVLDDVSDTCTKSCELHCEAVCEAGSCEGFFEISVTCITNCELFCETGCEDVCEVTGIEIEDQIAATEPSTGNPIILDVKYGSFFKLNGVRYNGNVVVMNPSSGSAIILTIIAGELYYDGGITKYNGMISVTQTLTGDPVVFTVLDGRIVS
jgi:hypothetical protein